MKSIAEILQEIEELDKNKKKLVLQQRFLYPLLFQDDLYAIGYNHSLNKIKLKKTENFNLNEYFSFLTLKRLINGMRRKDNRNKLTKNYNKICYVNYNNHFYLKVIREGFAIIFKIFSSVQLEKPFIEKFNRWTNYQSIHSVFPFIEDHFSHSNYILNAKIPHFFHPELLIRLLRRRIQDASFFHALRSMFYKNKKLITLNTNSFFSQKEMSKLFIFLWHYYIRELEFFLINQWKVLDYFKSLSYLALLDKTDCMEKTKYIIKNPLWMKFPFFFL
jgi:hypothetical protein